MVGVPLMVITPPAQWADTPAGKPFAPDTLSFAIPVAPVVVWVIVGDNAVLTHNVGVEEAALTVLSGVTVIVPVAFTVPQPPVNKML